MSETKKDTKSESKPSPSEKKPTTKKVMKPKVKSEPVPPATSTESTSTPTTKKVPGPSIRVFVRKNGEEQGKALSFDSSAHWNTFTSQAKKLLSLPTNVTYRVFLSSLDELTASNQLRDGDILYLHDGELSTLLVGNSEANLWRTIPIILNEMVRRSDATRMAQFARMNFPVTDGQAFDPASFSFGPSQYPTALSTISSTTTNTTSPTKKDSPKRETKKSVEPTKSTKQEKTVSVPKKENPTNGNNNTGTTTTTSTSTSTSTSKNDYPSGRYQQRHVVNRRGGYNNGYDNNYRWNQTRASYVNVYEVEVIGGKFKGKKGTVSAHFWNKSENHDHFLLRVFLDEDVTVFQKIYSEDLKKLKETPIKKQLRGRDNEEEEEYESDGASA